MKARTSASGENGFGRKSAPGSSSPRRRISPSVDPDVNSTGLPDASRPTAAASSEPRGAVLPLGSGPAAYRSWTILATEGTSLPFRMNTM